MGQSVIVFDASSNARDFKLKAIDESHVLLFAGKRLKEPIAWHGPIVMNTQEEIMQTFKELRSGNSLPSGSHGIIVRLVRRDRSMNYEQQLKSIFSMNYHNDHF